MKRLSKKIKTRFMRQKQSVIRQWEKLARSIAAKKGKERRREKKNILSRYTPAMRYQAPKVVTIDQPELRSELLQFLAQLRFHYRNNSSRALVIDFSQTTHFVSEGTLLLYAELNRLTAFCNNSIRLRCTEPANDRASQVLKQIGIYQLCSNQSKVRPTRDDVVHWQVVQGTFVDNTLCAPTIEGYQDRLDADMIDELLGGLGEAMTNAIHHAYEDIRQDELNFVGESN